MTNGSEKRNEPRFFTGGMVSYKIPDDFENTGASGFHQAEVLNVSAAGISILSDREFRQGTIIEIDLRVEKNRLRPVNPIHAFCSAKWSRESGPGIYTTGFEFIVIKQRDLKLLKKCRPAVKAERAPVNMAAQSTAGQDRNAGI